MFRFLVPQDRTDITVVLDRSGSMASIAKQTEEGFTAFLEKQKKLPGDCRLSLVQFDTLYEVVYRHKPIRKAPRLRLAPRGGTALLDAMGRTLVDKARELEGQGLARRPSRIMMVVITDGQENSSREFTRDQILELTRQYTLKHDWQFVYLGANQDAIQVASQMGIDAAAAMTYQAGARGTANAWEAAASLVARKRCASPETMCGHGFTPAERSSAAARD